MKLTREEYKRLEFMTDSNLVVRMAAEVTNIADAFTGTLIEFGVDTKSTAKILFNVYFTNVFDFSVDYEERLSYATTLALYIAAVWNAVKIAGTSEDTATDLCINLFRR